MSLSKLSCEQFACALASKEPTPGGGGASALVGAVGAALCSMVCNFTVGKKKYAGVEADITEIMDNAQKLRLRLLELIDADADAFAPLAKAYSIPKDDPARQEIMDLALIKACESPLETLRCCREALELLSETLKKGNTMLVTDVGTGAACCKAAIEGACMNIFVNTAALSDRTKARTIETEAEDILEKYRVIADNISNEVISRIRKEA